MLSKSRGQVLRIATIFHVLFSIKNEEDVAYDSEVSEVTVKAAVNFVQNACQQTAFIAGKGLIQEEVQAYKTGVLCINSCKNCRTEVSYDCVICSNKRDLPQYLMILTWIDSSLYLSEYSSSNFKENINF